MSASVVSNPPTQTESKSAKKKRAKAEASGTGSHESAASNPGVGTPTESVANGGEGIFESPYLKELQRNIRNTTKKLNASQKIDSILAENPGKTLDELVAAKKINADQKTSAEKKPGLIAQINQLEEQVTHYKKFGQEYEQRFAGEKAALEKSHKEELERVKEEVGAEHTSTSGKKTEEDLLVFSRFLRAAAAKRQSGDATSNENRAFEGALLQVYGGEAPAVAAIQKIISGAEEQVPATDSELVDYTYAQVKQSSVDFPSPDPEDSWTEDAAQSEAPTISGPGDLPTPPAEAPPNLASDPTLVNAGMTELEDGPATNRANGFSTPEPDNLTTPPNDIPVQSTIDSSAANAVASSSWDRDGDLQASSTLSASGDGWVDVQAPRDPTETDTGLSATLAPAAIPASNSWAEEVSVEHATATPTNGAEENIAGGDDGFHEVVRDHGRGASGRGRGYRGGERRGRGEGGGHRGRGGFNRERGDRGDRGDRGSGEGGYRGRGRGGGGYRGRGRGGQEGGGN